MDLYKDVPHRHLLVWNSAPNRTSHTERDAEQCVTLFPNKSYPNTRRQRARFVTKKDPIIVYFTRHPDFAHINAIGDQRYYREKLRENRQPNPGPPLDIDAYIKQCRTEGMLEGSRYAAMANDSGSGTVKKSRQNAWKARWAHTGQDGRNHLATQPSDKRRVRCSVEVEYQGGIGGLMEKLRDLLSKEFVCINRRPGVLLRPITSWYMFMNYEYWDEDALFEHRTRASRTICQRDANGRPKYVSVPGIIVGWQEVGMYQLNAEERGQVYFGTPPQGGRH